MMAESRNQAIPLRPRVFAAMPTMIARPNHNSKSSIVGTVASHNYFKENVSVPRFVVIVTSIGSHLKSTA